LEIAPAFTLSKTASADRCRHCNSAIWTVICRVGFRRYLDTQVLSIREQLAVLGNLETFRIWRTGEGFEVDPRSLNDIIWSKGKGLILQGHDCSQSPFTATWPDYWPRLIPPTTQEEGFPF
jgi:hypothetical protein